MAMNQMVARLVKIYGAYVPHIMDVNLLHPEEVAIVMDDRKRGGHGRGSAENGDGHKN